MTESRKAFVESSIQLRKEQLQEGNLSLADRNRLEAEIAAFEQELVQIEADEVKTLKIEESIEAPPITIPDEGREYSFNVNFNQIFETSILNDRIQDIIDALLGEQRLSLHNYYNTQLEEKEAENRRISEQLEENKAYVAEITTQKNQVLLERNEYELKFNNAGELIKELQDEVARLKSREIDLMEQVEKAPLLYPHRVTDIRPTNVDGDEIARLRAEELAKKPKIWDVVWEDDIRKTKYKAVDESGTVLSIPMLELGKYNVQVGPRPEPTSAQVAEESVALSVAMPVIETPALPEAPFPADFQIPSGSETMAGDSAVSESNESLSLEARVAALEAQVFGFVKGNVA